MSEQLEPAWSGSTNRRTLNATTLVVDDPVFSSRDAARYLNVCEGTLSRWRRAGTGPTFLHISRTKCSYRRSALDAFLASRERTSTRTEAAT